MKPLSKNALRALDILKAGGFSLTNPTYGSRVTLHLADEETVDGFGRGGRAKAVRFELLEAGYTIDEEMDGRNLIVGRIIDTTEVTS